MSVKRLSLLFFSSLLASGCSVLERPVESLLNPTDWFSDHFGDEQGENENPMESEQVTLATGMRN